MPCHTVDTGVGVALLGLLAIKLQWSFFKCTAAFELFIYGVHQRLLLELLLVSTVFEGSTRS